MQRGIAGRLPSNVDSYRSEGKELERLMLVLPPHLQPFSPAVEKGANMVETVERRVFE